MPEKSRNTVFELTKEQEAAYLEKPMGCPACDNCNPDTVRMGGLESDGGVARAENECFVCGLIWQDVYELVGVNVSN